MASYNMNRLPELEVGSTLEQVNNNLKTVKNWLFQLDEQLRYNLYNIEEENLTQETVDRFTSVSDGVKAELSVLDGKITAAVSHADGRFSQLQVSIDGISARVGDAEGSISYLEQTATSLTSAVQDVEGNISVLQQTASGLQTSVSNLEGDFSSIEQSVDSITLGVSNGTSSSVISLYKDGIAVASKTIQFTGVVTFSDLSGSGTTTINGANIKTGTISADRIAALSRISVGNSYVQCSTSGVVIYSSTGGIELGAPGASIMANGTIYGNGSPNAFVASGNIVASSYQIAAYSGKFTGWCYAPDWTNGSDQKLKKDIETLPEEAFSAFILSLRPVQYRYRADQSGKLRLGFIAQEIQKSLAGIGYGDTGALVTAARLSDGDIEDTLTLSYTDIIAPLVALVQRQQREIEAIREAIGMAQ